MPDNTANRGPAGRSRINIHQPYEGRDWCASLGGTAAQLRAAVAAVGTSATALRIYLGK